MLLHFLASSSRCPNAVEFNRLLNNQNLVLYHHQEQHPAPFLPVIGMARHLKKLPAY
jgi:hypothetical protein